MYENKQWFTAPPKKIIYTIVKKIKKRNKILEALNDENKKPKTE